MADVCALRFEDFPCSVNAVDGYFWQASPYGSGAIDGQKTARNGGKLHQKLRQAECRNTAVLPLTCTWISSRGRDRRRASLSALAGNLAFKNILKVHIQKMVGNAAAQEFKHHPQLGNAVKPLISKEPHSGLLCPLNFGIALDAAEVFALAPN